MTPGKSSKAPNGLCRSDAARSELLEAELPDISVELMLLSPGMLAPPAAPEELPPAEPANGLLFPAGAPPTAEPAPLLPLAKGLLLPAKGLPPPELSLPDPLPELEESA